MNKKLTTASSAGAAAFAAVLLLGNAGSALAATAFTRDLTIGSSGSDVTALQTMLIGEGYSIPSGPTGYFGTQTKAALSSYQAAHHIVPAAGYFGSITRASVQTPSNTDTSSGNGSTGGTTTGTVLTGNEASLRNFNLTSGNDLAEGEVNEEIAVAEFDVKGGDVRVQRVTVEMTAQNTVHNTQPWKYVDSLSIYSGSKKVGSIAADSRDDWSKEGSGYSIDIPVDVIVKEGDSAELSIRADAQNSIDSSDLDQTFSIVIPTNGIRAVDPKNIQKYIGKDSDTVTLGFNGEDNGKLTIRESSDNPDASVILAEASKTSDKADVLSFDVRNANDADVDIDQLTVRVDAAFADGSVTGEDVQSIIHRATLKIDGKTYTGTVNNTDSGDYEGAIVFKNLRTVVDGNDSVNGELTIDLFGNANRYDAGAALSFDVLASDIEAEGHDSGDPSEITGTVNGNQMTITTDAGLQLAGRTNTAVVTSTDTINYATYKLSFDVTALGDDVYVPRTVSVDGSASTTAGVEVVTMSDTPFTGSVSAVLTSTAKGYNDTSFVVREGETKTFTVSVTIDPDTAGFYGLGTDYVQFSSVSSNGVQLQKLDVDQNKTQFRTDPVYIPA